MYLVLLTSSQASYLFKFSRVTEQELLNKYKLQFVFPDMPFSQSWIFYFFFLLLLSCIKKHCHLLAFHSSKMFCGAGKWRGNVLLCLMNVPDHESQVCFELLQENAIDNKKESSTETCTGRFITTVLYRLSLRAKLLQTALCSTQKTNCIYCFVPTKGSINRWIAWKWI